MPLLSLEYAIIRCKEIFSTYDNEFVERVVTDCYNENVSWISSYVYENLPVDKPEYTKGFWIGVLDALVGEC